MIALPSLLLSTLLAVAAPQAPLPAGDAEIETKSYVLPMPASHRTSASFKLLPFRRADTPHEGDGQNIVDPGQILDLLRATVAPERWEEPGHSMRLESRARLTVSATPEMHADIARVITFLDAHLGQTQDFAVELYPVSAGAGIPSEVGGVVPAAACQRFVEELRASKALGTPRAWTMRAAPLGYASGGGGSEHELIVDLDVEIAQAAAIADPVVDPLVIGSRTTLRATPMTGGVCVHLLCSHSDLLAPIAGKQVGIYRELSHVETGKFEREVLNFEVQHPRVGFASSATTIFVPEGSELLQLYRAKSPWGESGRLLRLRPLTRPKAPRSLAVGQRVLALRDLSAAHAWNVEYGISDAVMTPRSRGGDDASGAYANFGEPMLDEFLEALRSGTPESLWEQGLDVQSLAGMLMITGNADGVSTVDALVETKLSAQVATENLVFLLQDRTGQEMIAQVSLATLPGYRCLFSAGADTLAITDYDVEVAQSSAIADPKCTGVAHGILGDLRTIRYGDLLILELDAVIHVLGGDFEATAVNAWLDTPIERFHGARVRVNENLRLAAGESVRIGDLDPEGKSGLMLTIMRR